ncbi:hypothetical protein J6590_066399 [Homalodisca vitripennis]|nr:hypothetical protein J6590_066399 [Homalodisca vitripennis]
MVKGARSAECPHFELSQKSKYNIGSCFYPSQTSNYSIKLPSLSNYGMQTVKCLDTTSSHPESGNKLTNVSRRERTIVPRHVRRLTGCGMNDKSRMRSNANSSDGPTSRGARGQSTQSYHE